jgi:hypothetical protein
LIEKFESQAAADQKLSERLLGRQARSHGPTAVSRSGGGDVDHLQRRLPREGVQSLGQRLRTDGSGQGARERSSSGRALPLRARRQE